MDATSVPNTVVMHISSKSSLRTAAAICIVNVFGEVTKSVRGMPWHWKAMKDVVTCDKLRVGGSSL